MDKRTIISRYVNRAAFFLLHGGMILIAAAYAVMLFVDASEWKGWFSIAKALFYTYSPAAHTVLTDPAVIIGWSCIALAGSLSVCTALYILKTEFKSQLHQVSQAALVFAPMVVIGLLFFFKGNKPVIQTVSLLGWIAVSAAFTVQNRYLPVKAKGASEFIVNIVFFAALFFMVNIYAHRNDVILDVSTARFYSLSGTTKKLLNNLDKKVKVYAVLYSLRSRKHMIYDYTEKLFNQISNAADNIDIEFVAPFSKKAENIRMKYNVKERHEVLIFECGEKTKAIPVTENGEPLAVLKQEDRRDPFADRRIPEIEAYRGENIFYLAVREVTSEQQKQVLFLEGHGERSVSEYSDSSVSELSNELKNLNCDVLTTTLRQGELPVCDTLVIPGPRTPFAEWEKDLIHRFLRERNGSLIYFAEPLFRERSVYEAGLADITADYGIELRDDYVIVFAEKLKTHLPEISTDTYGYHPITKSFTNEQVHLASMRSLGEGTCKEPRMRVTSLFSAASGADYTLWGETRIGLKTRSINPDVHDTKSPFSLAMLAGPRDAYATPRIIVIGDADIASNRLIGKGNNKRFILNCFNWALKQKDVDVIEPRNYEYIKLDVSDELMASIGYLVVICLPGFIMLYGILVLIRRRA